MAKEPRNRRRSREQGEAAVPSGAASGTELPEVASGEKLSGLDESLGLGDGDVTSTLFFSSAPPPPSSSSVVIEDWSVGEQELSKQQLERKGRLKRIALVVITMCAVAAILAVGAQVSKHSRTETFSGSGRN